MFFLSFIKIFIGTCFAEQKIIETLCFALLCFACLCIGDGVRTDANTELLMWDLLVGLLLNKMNLVYVRMASKKIDDQQDKHCVYNVLRLVAKAVFSQGW